MGRVRGYVHPPMANAPEIVVTAVPLARAELERLVRGGFGDMVKLVVDVERAVIAVGGQLQADAEALLLEQGSRRQDLWGANYFPGRTEWLEHTALINIRPADGNPGMEVADAGLRERVRALVAALVGMGEAL